MKRGMNLGVNMTLSMNMGMNVGMNMGMNMGLNIGAMNLHFKKKKHFQEFKKQKFQTKN
jgi:hypothetical protein